MKPLALILLVFVLGSTLLGSINIFHDSEHAMTKCVGSLVSGEKCPTSIAGFVYHKIGAVKIFASVLVSVLTLILAIFVISNKKRKTESIAPPWLSRWKSFYRELSQSKNKIISWLALLEHSPSF